MAQRNAAGQIWPHLPSAAREPVKQRTKDLASLMYPSQTKEAKAAQAFRERDKQSLLRGLRELRERMRGGR